MIVFIDDIDRLEPDVTRLMFRMIRLTANLPYLIYVLSFDRMLVEKKLDDDKRDIHGRDYIEKIVQVSLISLVRERLFCRFFSPKSIKWFKQ